MEMQKGLLLLLLLLDVLVVAVMGALQRRAVTLKWPARDAAVQTPGAATGPCSHLQASCFLPAANSRDMEDLHCGSVHLARSCSQLALGPLITYLALQASHMQGCVLDIAHTG